MLYIYIVYVLLVSLLQGQVKLEFFGGKFGEICNVC